MLSISTSGNWDWLQALGLSPVDVPTIRHTRKQGSGDREGGEDGVLERHVGGNVTA